MKLRQLRELIARATEESLDKEIKVWLPGSTIRLDEKSGIFEYHGMLCLEGNLDPGSALADR
jgi:hypothetical protein